jgi:hypothetical protein
MLITNDEEHALKEKEEKDHRDFMKLCKDYDDCMPTL